MGQGFSPAAPPLQAGEGEGRTGSCRSEGGEPIYPQTCPHSPSFIHLILPPAVSGIAPRAPDTTGNKTDKHPCPPGVYILVRGSRQDSK